jgi:hypothetical protein
MQPEFLAFGIQKTIHRAYDNTAGLIVEADALIAFIGVDDKIFIAHRDRAGRAFGLAKTAIDASIGNR